MGYENIFCQQLDTHEGNKTDEVILSVTGQLCSVMPKMFSANQIIAF